jgi:ribonuclease VapC
MFLDASAVVAIMEREAGWQDLQTRIEATASLWYSALARFEVAQAIARRQGGARKPTAVQFAEASGHVDRFFADIKARVVDIDAKIGSLAIEASMRYGKAVGHPADLNLGDCFAYACAKSLNIPLLYKGEDFAQTDLA